MCGEKSEATDHIEPHAGRKEVFERNQNFLALCHPCHNTITGKFDMHYRPGNSIDEKIKWMNEQREKNQILKNITFKKPKAMNYE